MRWLSELGSIARIASFSREARDLDFSCVKNAYLLISAVNLVIKNIMQARRQTSSITYVGTRFGPRPSVCVLFCGDLAAL